MPGSPPVQCSWETSASFLTCPKLTAWPYVGWQSVSGPWKLPARLGSYMPFLGVEVMCVPTLPWPSSALLCGVDPPALVCCIIVYISGL